VLGTITPLIPGLKAVKPCLLSYSRILTIKILISDFPCFSWVLGFGFWVSLWVFTLNHGFSCFWFWFFLLGFFFLGFFLPLNLVYFYC